MSLYEDRMSVLRSEMNYESALMRNKARFIKSVTDGEIDLVSGRQSRETTASRLNELGFDTNAKLLSLRNDNATSRRNGSQEVVTDFSSATDFDYLLNMPISSLTSERIEGLHADANKKDAERDKLQKSTAKDLWNDDLDKLASAL